MSSSATLHFFCGKAGAGKSTLARKLAQEQGLVLISEDLWLSRLYGDQIHVFDDYIRFSRLLNTVVGPHVVDLLRVGLSVVLDFQANTRRRRTWLRSLFEEAGANHVLHVLQTPEHVCLERIAKRNAERPEGSSHLTEEDFRYVSSFFEEPQESEGFNVRLWLPAQHES